MSYQLSVSGKEWWTTDDREEILDYARHLVEMSPYEPEVKTTNSKVVDLSTGEVLYEGVRTKFKEKRV